MGGVAFAARSAARSLRKAAGTTLQTGRAAVGGGVACTRRGNELHYLDYLANNADALAGTGWSIKPVRLGRQILLQGWQAGTVRRRGQTAPLRQGPSSRSVPRQKADLFACACLGKAGATNAADRTPAAA
ncbi:hypothetical protein PR202_gb27150 [Eleusine coracana subsp. coracana]|uniref:Uncharacterized protein n=1 Tax=Eleusine coracana subsp. coracana TaxID=191504 RepID=A0AAV5FTQ2_ELECO|nr:hypothetical protein PR202_gb27150 [Eleusine coracana subsp. coracana]